MNTLGDRIRILRSGRALTQQAVAEALGVSRSAVAMWEKDEREPNLETLAAAGKTAGRAAFGAGGAQRSAPACKTCAPCARGAYRCWGPSPRASPSSPRKSTRRTWTWAAACGRTSPSKSKAQSMEPVYKDGDVVYIRSQDDVLDGQVAAVVIDDSATLKRVYHLPIGVQLMPINPALRAHALHRGKQRQRAHPWAGGGLFPQNGLTRAPSKRIFFARDVKK